jgi:exopolysaccharide production negative regulator
MWQRLARTAWAITAFGAVVAADDMAYAQSPLGNLITSQDDHRPVLPCDNGTPPLPGWRCQPTPHTPYHRAEPPPPSPEEALRSGMQALREGRTKQALMDLEYAAAKDIPGALWKLGRMYADGDGVKIDKGRAYGYFRNLILHYGLDSVGTPEAPLVAKGYVALGLYYLEGIPGALKADPNVAQELFEAASDHADPEAQYHLGRLHLEGRGAPKDAVTAARWLSLSANNNDPRAQALLGDMLFKGDQVAREGARGLFWLTVAKEAAGPDEGWMTDMYDSAFAQASDSEKALAHKYLIDWFETRRE